MKKCFLDDHGKKGGRTSKIANLCTYYVRIRSTHALIPYINPIKKRDIYTSNEAARRRRKYVSNDIDTYIV